MKKFKSAISMLVTFCMMISMLYLGNVPTSAAVAGHVVISEAYGGGGNSGATFKNDFIELYNPTASDVNLAGWKVSYASKAGTTYTDFSIASGTIRAGGFFLIQAAKGTGGTVDLPTPDATSSLAMGGDGFKLKLIDAASALVDFLGAGAANESETAPAPAPSSANSVQRLSNDQTKTELSGGWDDNNNSTDFYAAAPTPKNATFGMETVAADPIANPVSGAVKIGTAVTLSTATASASITYKLNNGAVTPYTAPISLDEAAFASGTATIKAIASKTGLSDSKEVVFTYTVKVPPQIITTTEAKTMADGTEVRVKGVVTYSTQGRTIFLQDATGGICVDSGSSSTILSGYVGKEIDVTGIISPYNKMVQVKPVSLDDIKITNETPVMPTPLIVTINELNNSNRAHESMLIKVENCRITAFGTGTSTMFNHTVAQGNDSITLRAAALTGRNVGDTITITGVAGYFSTAPQIQANVSDIVDGVAPAVETVTADPATGSVLPAGSSVKLSTATADASIIYTLNGGAQQTINTNNGTVTIDGFATDGKATIIAKAAKGGYNSAETTFVYSQAKSQVVSASPVGAIAADSQVTLTAANNAVIRYIVTKKAGLDGETSDPEQIYATPIQLTEDMLPATITAYATQEGYLPSDSLSFNFTLAANNPYKNYFGQLHSHTAENSDGSGTLAEAYTYARDNAKLDFFAVTDHSNSFDNKPAADKAGTYNLGEYNKNDPEWVKGQQAAASALRDNFISVYAYEMTWSGGPGHMNTFATDGFVSRNNTELNTKANDAGLKAYYQLLKDTPNSITQFNHPGATFGTFSDFSYLDPAIDAKISLLEVGNGEGAVGSGSYFPSYDEYNKALDKGWHVAPTNNQDNHKGKWGDSNTARTVIYTNDLSVNGLYDALRNMRVYATEDNNLDIVYTLNGNVLGSIIQQVPGQAAFKVSVKDPDASDRIKSISIISVGGKSIYTQSYSSQVATLDKTIENPAPGYYYIRVEEEDKQIAVTAPIWLGSAPMLGINSLEYDVIMPVTNEPILFTTKLFNNENEAIAVKSVTYRTNDGTVIGNYESADSIASKGMYTNTLSYVFTQPGVNTVTVTAVLSKNGVDTSYTKTIDVNVRDSEKLLYVGIDASHDNEYVAGNYKASMGNFAKLAAKFNVRVVELKTSAELIAAMQNPKYQMMVYTVPSRRDGTVGRIPFKSYSQAEIDATAAFARSGKTVIVTGWGDYYENYTNLKSNTDFTAEQHMAAQQNKLLAAIGAKLRIGDDEAKDNTTNGGQAQRLYLTDHNGYLDPFTQGVVAGQVYSQYGGSSIYAVDESGAAISQLPTNIIPTISGFVTTFSSNDDKDGVATPPKYNSKVLLMANETITHTDGTLSTVIAAGGAFMSNFEVQVEVDNSSTLPYSNYNILQNIIASLANISTIEQVRSMPVGTDVAIEGIATTNVYNGGDSNTGFFDCIYVQDQTGGINLFPVSSGVQAGQKIRVTGTVGEYQGEKQIQNAKVTVINYTKNLVAPKVVTPGEAMLPSNTGSLLAFKGIVTEIKKDNDGVVGQLMVGGARVYINGYITKGVSLSDIKVGDAVFVTGVASIGENMSSDTEFLPRIRISDRAEIVLNTIPAVNVGEDVTITEGSSFKAIGTFADKDIDTWTAKVNYGDGTEEVLALNADKTFNLNHTYVNDGTYTVAVTIDDGFNGIGADTVVVTVNNVAPRLTAIEGYTVPVNKTSEVSLHAALTDAGVTDTHTAIWNWGDGTTSHGTLDQEKGSAQIAGNHAYAKAGTYTVQLTVMDNFGASATAQLDVVVMNITPVVEAGADVTIVEGDTYEMTGSFTDADADIWKATVNYGDGTKEALVLNGDKTFNLNHVYVDNGTYQVSVTVNDGDGGITTDNATITVNNVAPSVSAISGYNVPLKKGTTLKLKADFTDQGKADKHIASWSWGDGTTSVGTVAEGEGTGQVAGSHAYAKAGIYTVKLTVTDNDSANGSRTLQQVVVYDPNAGFLTGGGWFNSAAGACKTNVKATGKAKFDFDIAYGSSSVVPTGSLSFQFSAGNLSFVATSFDWMVVTGNKVQIKGTGKVNGNSGYQILVTAVDGGKKDLLRIQILNSTGDVVYDNINSNNSIDTIDAGNIIVH